MNELKIFTSEEFGRVRTVMLDDEPWFVAKDVSAAFGDMNSNRSTKRVEECDKTTYPIVDALGRERDTTVVNESGLYDMLFAMKPQKANHDRGQNAYPIEIQERIEKLQRFKRWVTHDVLPSIRRHGLYAIDEILANPDMAIKAFTALKQEQERAKALQEKVDAQTLQIAEMSPKASYYDVVINCKDLVSISAITKDYGWSANRLNDYLHEKGVQYKQGKIWLLYQKYASGGYTSTKTTTYAAPDGNIHAAVHTHWTQKGRLFIYEIMKRDGHYPIVERENAK